AIRGSADGVDVPGPDARGVRVGAGAGARGRRDAAGVPGLQQGEAGGGEVPRAGEADCAVAPAERRDDYGGCDGAVAVHEREEPRVDRGVLCRAAQAGGSVFLYGTDAGVRADDGRGGVRAAGAGAEFVHAAVERDEAADLGEPGGGDEEGDCGRGGETERWR